MSRRIQCRQQKKDPLTGRKFCLVCPNSVAKGRRSYCSHECCFRNTPNMIRIAVADRDKGICAACGVQCQCRFTRHLPAAERRAMPDWQADHIVPVAEGGGLCGLDGYRTLCVPCHKKETAALAARLAAKKKAQRIVSVLVGGLFAEASR